MNNYVIKSTPYRNTYGLYIKRHKWLVDKYVGCFGVDGLNPSKDELIKAAKKYLERERVVRLCEFEF